MRGSGSQLDREGLPVVGRNHAEAGYPAVALTAVGGEDGEEDGAEVSRAPRPELHGSEVPGRIAPRPDIVTVAAVEQSDARIAAN